MPKTKIFVVDDDHTTASVIRLYLEGSGYKVSGIACTGREAIEESKSKKPDIVLMDIDLGQGMDGIDAAEVINKHLGIPIVFVTAYADKATLARAKRADPAGYINKPLRQKDLQTTLEFAITKVKRPRSNRPKSSDGSIEDILESIYNLTPAEARVATKMIEYPQLSIAAEALNISLSTAKTHLKRIYRKTNTNRQSILIHKIVNGPAGLMMNERIKKFGN